MRRQRRGSARPSGRDMTVAPTVEHRGAYVAREYATFVVTTVRTRRRESDLSPSQLDTELR